MRISADKDDPGYRPQSETADLEIFLDGVKQEQVVTADTNLGFILRYSEAPFYRLRIGYGKVEIKRAGKPLAEGGDTIMYGVRIM